MTSGNQNITLKIRENRKKSCQLHHELWKILLIQFVLLRAAKPWISIFHWEKGTT